MFLLIASVRVRGRALKRREKGSRRWNHEKTSLGSRSKIKKKGPETDEGSATGARHLTFSLYVPSNAALETLSSSPARVKGKKSNGGLVNPEGGRRGEGDTTMVT